MTGPVILVDPHPRTLDLIFDAGTRPRLEALGELVVHEGEPKHLPEAVLIVGQTPLPAERLQRARKLRAVINVETNFLPNIDYDYCFREGIHVLAPGSAFAPAVAEAALAMAIDLVRGITAADRAFRAGREQYGLSGNEGAFMFTRARSGLSVSAISDSTSAACSSRSGTPSRRTILGSRTISCAPMTWSRAISTTCWPRRGWFLRSRV